MAKLTFNKKAQRAVLDTLKRLETGSFISAVLGSFGANPRVTALMALALFLVCRVCQTIVLCIEEPNRPAIRNGRADAERRSQLDADGGK
ncbi:hypothetical protein GJ700_02595 [Duganella sp. FT92W]|uniref:Uncharacterized protein n=1 Tax=Pseudoduganella rivuli TaxID=2666085 RepID=A0A7X2LRA3_9BURK|nr:hypothetical protein [Pseudoduganella rivuli]MRV70608.1 hypothetical protein [Pseudoduganella rivuli]